MMNPLTVLRDAWFFFQRNLPAIAVLCLPWLLLQNLAEHAVSAQLDETYAPAASLLTGLLFYPLYSAALILFIDARSRGLQPRYRDLLAAALPLWPRFAVLATLSSLLIMLGISMLVLPGLWMMVKLGFAEYLLVLRGHTPLAAARDSIRLSTGHFWPLLACILTVMTPLWLLDGYSYQLLGDPPEEWLSLLLDTSNGFLQLFSTVVLFRYFMLLDSSPAPRADA